MRQFDLLLIGFGRVARRFVELIDERRSRLQAEGVALRVIGIATARHGRLLTPKGLSPRALVEASQTVSNGGVIGDHAEGSSRRFIGEAVGQPACAARARQGRLIVVETTTLDVAAGQPAIDHVLTALRGGAHVVTANKGPAAFAYARIARQAARAGRRFLFEGAVMDGVPVFSLVREALPGIQVIAFRGVVNSTTNYILGAMEGGQTFEQALQTMQKAGIAEADATLDVDGWDAAAKTAALANVLLDARLTPLDVRREGIGHATRTRVTAARASGRRLKLVASAERTTHGAQARVQLVEVIGTDLLAGLNGEQNALVLKTDLLDEIAIVQRGSGLTQTAYALLADVLTIARQQPGGRAGSPGATARVPRRSRARARRDRTLSPRGRRRS